MNEILISRCFYNISQTSYFQVTYYSINYKAKIKENKGLTARLPHTTAEHDKHSNRKNRKYKTLI
jgi:hypothetical protein